MNSLLQVVALLVVATFAENATAIFTYSNSTSNPENVTFEISPLGQLGGSQVFESPVVTTLTYLRSRANPLALYVQVIKVDAVGRNIQTSSVFANGINCTDLSNAITPIAYSYQVKIKFPDGTSDQITSRMPRLFSIFCAKLETDSEVCMILQGPKIIAYSPVAPQCQDSIDICFARYLVEAMKTCPLMNGRPGTFVGTISQLLNILGDNIRAFMDTVVDHVPKYASFG